MTIKHKHKYYPVAIHWVDKGTHSFGVVGDNEVLFVCECGSTKSVIPKYDKKQR